MIKNNIKEIEEEIKLNGHIEWRSKKNLDEFMLSNTFDKDICIVGYITSKTIQKWGLNIKSVPNDNNVFVAVKNNRICYLYGLPLNLYSSRNLRSTKAASRLSFHTIACITYGYMFTF